MLRNPSVKHMSPGFSQRSRCVGLDQCLSPRHWADFRRHTAFEDRMLVSRPVSLLSPPRLHVSTAPVHAFFPERTIGHQPQSDNLIRPIYLSLKAWRTETALAGICQNLSPYYFSLPIWHENKNKMCKSLQQDGICPTCRSWHFLSTFTFTVDNRTSSSSACFWCIQRLWISTI